MGLRLFLFHKVRINVLQKNKKNILESRDILVHFPNAEDGRGGVGGGHGLSHKVLTYVEYRAVSGVFQNIDPPHPSPPSECVLPPHQRWGVHTRRAVRG